MIIYTVSRYRLPIFVIQLDSFIFFLLVCIFLYNNKTFDLYEKFSDMPAVLKGGYPFLNILRPRYIVVNIL